MATTRKNSRSAVQFLSARYLSTREVLEWLGLSRWTLDKKWKEGSFPPPDPDVRGFRSDWVAEWQAGKRDWSAELQEMRAIPARRNSPQQRAARAVGAK